MIIKVNPYFYKNFSKFLKIAYMKCLGDPKVEVTQRVLRKIRFESLDSASLDVLKKWKHIQMSKAVLENTSVPDSFKKDLIIEVLNSLKEGREFNISVFWVYNIFASDRSSLLKVIEHPLCNITYYSWISGESEALKSIIQELNVTIDDLHKYPALCKVLYYNNGKDISQELVNEAQYVLVRSGWLSIDRFSVNKGEVLKRMLERLDVDEIVKQLAPFGIRNSIEEISRLNPNSKIQQVIKKLIEVVYSLKKYGLEIIVKNKI